MGVTKRYGSSPKRIIVYRVQDEDGEGPYGDSGMMSGVPQTRFTLPERGNKDYHQPLPENDFSTEDFEEFLGQGEEGHGAGHYFFGFAKAEDAVRWFGRDGIEALYRHGYRVKEVPASKVARSISGKQVFFEHHPGYDPRKCRDARGFEHPEG